MAQELSSPLKVRVKPRLRGISHRYAFVGALLPAVLLVWLAPSGRATWASAIYAGSLVGLLGTSALYHGVTWSERARFWVGRVDLVMIFVLIAGTYTPIAMLRLEPDLAPVVLTAVWSTALLGGIVKVIWRDPPKWASAAIYVSVGSVAIFFLPQVVAAIGPTATALMLVGGVLYGLGALVYGVQRPDPIPEVFGYHEIFHLFVIAAAGVHFAATALYVVPSP
jgi:hemolysin III